MALQQKQLKLANTKKAKKGIKIPKSQNNLLISYAKKDNKDVLASLDTSLIGLNAEQVEEKQDKYGKNEITFNKKTTWYKTLLMSFINPFSVILIIIAIISLILEVIISPTPNWSSFIIITVMVFLSGTIKFFQENRSHNASEKLKNMIETTTAVERNDIKFEIPMDEIVPGDIIHLAAGDLIPADLRIINAKDLFVAQAALTGESEPIEKYNVLLNKDVTAALECTNICFMGTTVVSGTALGVVVATGNNTIFGSIAKLITKKRPKTNFDKGIKAVSWLLIRSMVIMTLIVFIVNGFLKTPELGSTDAWLSSLMFALAIAVGLTPEMLPMIVTVNLAKEAVSMSKEKTIVKNINSIQSFGAMDILCTDKTGTLTEDRIVLERHLNIHGMEDNRVLMYGYLNSYYQTGLKNLLDLAIIEKAESKGLKGKIIDYKKVDEIPFDFKRRRMSIVLKNKKGKTELITKGALDEIFDICSLVEYKKKIVPLTDAIKAEVRGIVDNLSGEGMRVIAIARNDKDLPTDRMFSKTDESKMILIGYIALLDPPKKSSKQAIKALQKKGVEVKVLTGDSEKVSRYICGVVGIPTNKILLGRDVENLSDEELAKVSKKINLFARLSPEQKARVVLALKSGGHIVGFMGDGINDAPAMRVADVGISVDTAVDVAKESADIVLLEKDLMILEKGVIEGRKTYGNIIKYIKMTISSNFGNMLSMIIASFWLPFLPMQPVQILMLNMLYDFSQISIPWDHVDEEFMRHPQQWDASSLLKFMLCMGPVSTIFDISTFLVMYFIFGWNGIDGGGMSGAEKMMLFNTGWFVESLLSQILVVYIMRTKKLPFIQSNPSVYVVGSTTALLTIGISLQYVPGLSDYMGFYGLPWEFYGLLLCTGTAYLILGQLVKMLYIKVFRQWL